MPDGKRNSIPTEEGEPEEVNCYYDEDLQNSGNSPAKRLPLSLNSRSFHNLSDRLLRTMVANELKKTLGAEDNKKLVAHHRPVLQSENEASDSEMVVVGVVFSAKQSQNDEVTKAIEMLRRNGVSCVCFSLNKDPTTPNGTKKDDNTTTVVSAENGMPSEEILASFKAQSDESCLLSNDTAEKKVSSPTVSTTSDYASPIPPEDSKGADPAEADETLDTSCTSTTSPALQVMDPSSSKRESDPAGLLLSDGEKSDDQNAQFEQDALPNSTEVIQKNGAVDTTALRRKRRRKRLFPFVSRRKARNKRKRTEQIPEPQAENCPGKRKRKLDQEQDPSSTDIVLSSEAPLLTPEATGDPTNTSPVSDKSDPYEFEDSDLDSPVSALFETFKTPNYRNGLKDGALQRKKGPSSEKSEHFRKSASKRSAKKKGGAKKRSPRKRLTFSKPREFSPDITDHVDSAVAPRLHDGPKVSVVQLDSIICAEEEADNVKDECSPIESCVQPISKDNKKMIDTTQSQPSSEDNNSSLEEVKLVFPTPANGLQKLSPEPLVVAAAACHQHCDSDIRASRHADVDDKQVETRDTKVRVPLKPPPVAQEPCNVQMKEKGKQSATESSEFAMPAVPNDSLQDAPDSMQLRRSSFYSSISRNVRTNMEKYLDGRPENLKAPKRSKKIKNGFLLHHGDNFPDDPEAPYQLNLATQVLLKLNKRRVKCKPKEDKAKSLLSYLKLQPKRVSRVGKHSKPPDPDTAATKEVSSVFSGEWTVKRKYICNICGQVEDDFWDMVMHKGEVHPGIVVTHVELPNNPPEGFRRPPSPRNAVTLQNPPSCTKCSATFTTYPDLHRHVFECAGNAAVLEDATSKMAPPKKKKGKRKRGFKRRISGLPKKAGNGSSITTSPASIDAAPVLVRSGEITKRRNSEVFKCEFCTREFKTEGWLKNHVSLSHTLPVSIPLEKLSLPTRASLTSSRRFPSQAAKPPTKQLSRET